MFVMSYLLHTWLLASGFNGCMKQSCSSHFWIFCFSLRKIDGKDNINWTKLRSPLSFACVSWNTLTNNLQRRILVEFLETRVIYPIMCSACPRFSRGFVPFFSSWLKNVTNQFKSWSQWLSGLTRGYAADLLVGLRVRIPPGADSLSRGVLLTMVCPCVWSRNLNNEAALASFGLLCQKKIMFT